MDGTDFVVYSMILTEDADDVYSLTVTLHYTVDVKQQMNHLTLLTWRPNAYLHTVNSTAYKFLTMPRKEPQ